MLSFLRKLRRRQNRFTRYLIYAIGEIILVVVGILIALQVKNWNEGRKLKKQEETILKSISSEFEDNLNTIQESLERSERRGSCCRELLNQVGPTANTIDRKMADSLIFMGYISHVTVEPSDTYLNGLLSTGRIHISDPLLMEVLTVTPPIMSWTISIATTKSKYPTFRC